MSHYQNMKSSRKNHNGKPKEEKDERNIAQQRTEEDYR